MGGHINSRTYWWPYRMFACNNGLFVIVCYCHTFTHYFRPFLWVGGIRWFLPWGNDFGFCYSTRLILQWILSISPKKEIQYWRIHETNLKKLQITFIHILCLVTPLSRSFWFPEDRTSHVITQIHSLSHIAQVSGFFPAWGPGPPNKDQHVTTLGPDHRVCLMETVLISKMFFGIHILNPSTKQSDSSLVLDKRRKHQAERFPPLELSIVCGEVDRYVVKSRTPFARSS